MAVDRFLDRPSRCIWPLNQPNSYALTLIQRQTPLSEAANDKVVHSEDSELDDDGGQRSSNGNSDIIGSGGNNQLVSYIDYDYDIIITNIIGIKVLIILY